MLAFSVSDTEFGFAASLLVKLLLKLVRCKVSIYEKITYYHLKVTGMSLPLY